jgi:hypothetical protein
MIDFLATLEASTVRAATYMLVSNPNSVRNLRESTELISTLSKLAVALSPFSLYLGNSQLRRADQGGLNMIS